MAHCRVRGDLLIQLDTCFDGTGFCALPRFGVRIEDHSFLLPHAAVFPIGLDPDSTSGEPVVVAETHELHRYDQERDERVSLYRRAPSVRAILIADPYVKHVQLHERLGPHSWRAEAFTDGRDVVVTTLGFAIRHTEIFSRD